ncbi:FBP domain-containing protein [Lentzea sp. DG1S-22]|uniref:FBP domain-containing protein n=1 Tax=unclassified Lentzea TaxID=2643253 RepID=UPI0027E1D4ED|nr:MULTISPECIES: FBP domain-containing protein [unclassified Lentzea]MCG8927548.1 FBP domain-containing protein [Lentzea sp. CC55]WVH82617.1 FBP domain-containing protein [Lentzea sp. DG1S-22]
MKPLTELEIRASFVNSTKGEAKRMHVPRDLGDRPWDDLDFLGWTDPAAPDRSYLVAELDGRLVGIALRRAAQAGRARKTLCAWCLTTHSGDGVSLMTARKAGKSGQLGNSVGAYVCADLACSLYLRGKKSAGPGSRFKEAITLGEQVERMLAGVNAFVERVCS